MAPVRVTLHLMICCAAALKVSYCVCYVGEEPDQATGKRHGWSLAEQTPCECTEFRLGGVNMKPQLKPHEVKIGEDPRLTIDKQGQIVLSPACKEDQHGLTSQSTESVTPCSNKAIEFCTLTLQDSMSSPIRLTFTVQQGAEYVSVDFSTGDRELAQYEVYLSTNLAEFKVRSHTSGSMEADKSYQGTNCIGVPVTITYDDGHFEVAIAELADPLLTYDVTTTPPPTSWFVTFRSGNEIEIILFEPCNPDF